MSNDILSLSIQTQIPIHLKQTLNINLQTIKSLVTQLIFLSISKVDIKSLISTLPSIKLYSYIPHQLTNNLTLS